MTRKERYIKRLQVLKAVIKKVPGHLINLQTVGISVHDETNEHGPAFTTKDVIHCGTVGCLLGWSRTIPAARAWVGRYYGTFDKGDWDGHLDYYGQQQQHEFFFERTEPRNEGSDKAVALLRINDAIKELRR